MIEVRFLSEAKFASPIRQRLTFPGTGVLSKYAGGIFVTQDYKKREFFVIGQKSVRISTLEKTPQVVQRVSRKLRKEFFL